MPQPKPHTRTTSATRFTAPDAPTASKGCAGDLHARKDACATDATSANGTPRHRMDAYVSAAGTMDADRGPANLATAGAAATARTMATTSPRMAARATASETVVSPSPSPSAVSLRALRRFMRSWATKVVVATASADDRR